MPERPSGGSPGRGGAGTSAGAAVPDPAHAPAIELPATFGKYFLTEKLATGGMAEIYLAKIVGPGGFEKQLVIKQIHPRLTGQRHFVDLFVTEAKTLVTLAHGNVVPVYELGVIDDTYFIAMEYIDGPTLYRLTETLRRRGVHMAPAIAAWITARVLEGLDYAHRKGDGVIHRDLSPRNVMLSRDGEVKLVDFGIAVSLGADSEDDGQSAPTGSFPYMSPEQVRKEPLTGQTDLFSAGVLLWEMLVGHHLFARSDPDATLHAVIDGDIPRPSAENPEVPARLDDVVMRALERDMTARWASAGDMLAALQRYLYSLDDPPGPRDVAALVARYCPPETRRLPTHHDELAESEPSPQTRPRRAASVADEPRPGPMTAVIPRDGAGPRGKRSTRARTESFATNVDLAHMLERGAASGAAASVAAASGDRAAASGDGPDRAAARDGAGAAVAPGGSAPAVTPDGAERGEREDPTPIRPATSRRAARSADLTDDTGEVPAHGTDRAGIDRADAGRAGGHDADGAATEAAGRPDLPPLTLPGRTAPATATLVVAGLAALALGAAAVFVFFQGRGAVLRPDASRRDAELDLAPDTTVPSAAPTDGAPTDAASTDAAPDARSAAVPATAPVDAGEPVPPPTRDAAPAGPRDGGNHPRPDARPGELPRPDTPPHAAGTATLTVGAIPWGTVSLDGKPIGRTPIDHLAIPAGHHVISVTFGGEDPPRTLSYTVDLGAGESKDLVADFTRP